jgi:hypothetical protein
VSIKQVDQEAGLDEAFFIYASPAAIDAESDRIKMEFSGTDLPCSCLTVKSTPDGLFVLEL